MTYLHCSERVASVNFFLWQRKTQKISWARREREGNTGKLKSWAPSSCSSTPAETKNATCSHATSNKDARSYSKKRLFALFPLTSNNNHFPKSNSTAVFPGPFFHADCSGAAPVKASHRLPITVRPPQNSPSIQRCLQATSWNPPWFQTQQVNKAVHKCSATWLSAYCLALPNNRALWLSHKKQPEELFEYSSCCQGSQC